MDRIPTLDGWRGIAITLVFVTHLQISLLGHLYHGYRWLDLGQHGVTLFFVLSGYLITSRLLGEEKINLGSFYLRRFFRLMPCAWAYLLILGIVAVVAHADIVAAMSGPASSFSEIIIRPAKQRTTSARATFGPCRWRSSSISFGRPSWRYPAGGGPFGLRRPQPSPVRCSDTFIGQATTRSSKISTPRFASTRFWSAVSSP
jgi:hypothetical protein